MWSAEYCLPLRTAAIWATALRFGSRMAVSMPLRMPSIRVWLSGTSGEMKAIALVIICGINITIVKFEISLVEKMLTVYDRDRNLYVRMYDF